MAKSTQRSTEVAEFTYEEDVRRRGFGILAGMIATYVGLTAGFLVLIPDLWGRVSAFAIVSLAFLAGAAFAATLIQAGGRYRVKVQGGRLSVSSPTSLFGASFERRVEDILQLTIVRHSGSAGPSFSYYVDDKFSRRIEISANSKLPVRELFACLKRLNREIHYYDDEEEVDAG